MDLGPGADIPTNRFVLGIVTFAVALVLLPVAFAVLGWGFGTEAAVAEILLAWLLPWVIFYAPAVRRRARQTKTPPS